MNESKNIARAGLDISISSIDLPSVSMAKDTVIFSFSDWHGQVVEIRFRKVQAYRWFNRDCERDAHDDEAFEVIDSDWISELAAGDKTLKQKKKYLHHYQFCVYGSWLFEIIAEGFSRKVGIKSLAESSHYSWDGSSI